MVCGILTENMMHSMPNNSKVDQLRTGDAGEWVKTVREGGNGQWSGESWGQVNNMVKDAMPEEILEGPFVGPHHEGVPMREVLREGWLQRFEELFVFHRPDVCVAEVRWQKPFSLQMNAHISATNTQPMSLVVLTCVGAHKKCIALHVTSDCTTHLGPTS